MKTLYRSRKQKVMAGVAGGIAEYFDIDPVFIRVLFVVSIFASGVGIIAYIVLWIVTPQEPFEYAYKTYTSPNQSNNPTGDDNSSSHSEFDSAENSSDFSNFYRDTDEKQEVRTETKSKIKIFGGSLLVILGLVILLDEIIPELDFTYIWSSLLILIGIFIIFSKPNRNKSNE